MNKIALITGATAGIGKATAKLLAKKGYHLIITGRRKNLLEDLSSLLAKKYHIKVLTLCFDIRNYDELKQSLNGIPASWKNIDVLINNAGLASGLDGVDEANLDDWDRMIDTNIKGLLYISRFIVPDMVAAGKGHIINISSIAGKEVYPKGSVYCATKHAVDALTKGMRMDLYTKGIRVSSVSPGAVETEFSKVRFHWDESKAAEVYKGFEPLIAEDIADAVWYILSRPERVNINDILIMPSAQASAMLLNKQQ